MPVIVRWVVRILAWSVSLALLTAVILIIQGHGLATRHLSAEFQPLRVLPDSTRVARGRHLSEIRCAGCHAPDLSQPDVLSGGSENYLALPGGPSLGTLAAPNLTPAGTLAKATDLEIARAIRQGISVHGGPLLVMPSAEFRAISDSDLAALIAFLRSQPAASHPVPARRLNLLAYLVLGLHKVEDSVVAPVTWPVADAPPESTLVFGSYMLEYLGCRECHGPLLRGGIPGQLAPMGPDLVAFAKAHDLAGFDLALRHGVKPAGPSMDPSLMPWTTFSRLTDSEVAAMYARIHDPGY
jgi:mono/diheme cytochrome c family protein